MVESETGPVQSDTGSVQNTHKTFRKPRKSPGNPPDFELLAPDSEQERQEVARPAHDLERPYPSDFGDTSECIASNPTPASSASAGLWGD
jgi:hypothetical protein